MTVINFHQKAIIFCKRGVFLALKASYKECRWDLPGGAVDIPETHVTALQREIREETGTEVRDIVPVKIATAYNAEDDSYTIFIGYKCVLASGDLKLSSEHTSYRWITKEEFHKLDAPLYLKEFVSDAIGKL